MGAPRVTDLAGMSRNSGAAGSSTNAQQRELTARGEVAVAPTSEAQALMVVIGDITRQYGIEVPAGNWGARGSALPVAGDTCLVVFDNVGDAFVPVWGGTTAISPAPTVWHPLPYNTTNWTDNGSVQAGEYGKDALGFVHVRGVAKSVASYSFSTASTLTIATLPPGFRPGDQEIFDALQEDTTNTFNVMRCDVKADGTIALNGGNSSAQETSSTNNGIAAYLSLKHMVFEQVN